MRLAREFPGSPPTPCCRSRNLPAGSGAVALPDGTVKDLGSYVSQLPLSTPRRLFRSNLPGGRPRGRLEGGGEYPVRARLSSPARRS